MAELSQKEQLALHEFSLRYREALAKEHPLTDVQLGAIQDAVREQYQQEQDAKKDKGNEPSGPSREIEPPEPEA
jgi:hypothetical protein